jgi:hypothetical protein
MQQALRMQRARVGQHAYVSFIHTRLTATAATGSDSSAASSDSLIMAAIEIKADKTFVQAPVPEIQEDAVLVTLPGKAKNTIILHNTPVLNLAVEDRAKIANLEEFICVAGASCTHCDGNVALEDISSRNMMSVSMRLLQIFRGDEQIQVMNRAITCASCATGKPPVQRLHEHAQQENYILKWTLRCVVQRNATTIVSRTHTWKLGEDAQKGKHALAEDVLQALAAVELRCDENNLVADMRAQFGDRGDHVSCSSDSSTEPAARRRKENAATRSSP